MSNVVIQICKCTVHDWLCVLVNDLRITPSKCCGSWTAVKSWTVTTEDLLGSLKRAGVDLSLTPAGDTTIATARETFNALAELVVREVQPYSRAAATMRQIGVLTTDLPLTLADVVCGFEILRHGRGDDEPGNVTGRRATCGELSDLAHEALAKCSLPIVGDQRRLAAVFRAVAAAWGTSTDPREAAIAATALREAAELEA